MNFIPHFYSERANNNVKKIKELNKTIPAMSFYAEGNWEKDIQPLVLKKFISALPQVHTICLFFLLYHDFPIQK